MSEDESDEEFELTKHDVAAQLKVHPNTVDTYARQGRLRKKNGRFRWSEVDRLARDKMSSDEIASERALGVMTDHVAELTKLSVEERKESRQALKDAMSAQAVQLNAFHEMYEKLMNNYLEMTEHLGDFLLRKKEQEDIEQRAKDRRDMLQRAGGALMKVAPHFLSRLGSDQKVIAWLEKLKDDDLEALKMMVAEQEGGAELIPIIDSVLAQRRPQEVPPEPEGGQDGSS